MSVRAYAEIGIDLADKFHRAMIQLEHEYDKLGMQTPRPFRYAMKDLRFSMLRARDELRYLQGLAPDTEKSDPNGEVTHELSRGT